VTTSSAGRRTSHSRSFARVRGVNIWLTALLVLIAALFAFPMLWFLLSSFKPGSELFSLPLTLFPETWTTSGYSTA